MAEMQTSTTASVPTHYEALGLAPSAPLPVIHAAYKALILVHHPDKTVHLPHVDRATHASIFCAVQEAYDVLANASLKATYDAELQRDGNRVDQNRSTFHRPSKSSKPDSVSTPMTPKRHPSVKITTPEEKDALKAKAETDLSYLRTQRSTRDAEDSAMDISGLKSMLAIWTHLAGVHSDDDVLRVHCALQMQVYMDKIAERDKEHYDWLDNMAKPKSAPSTPEARQKASTTPGASRKMGTSRLANANIRPTGAPRTASRTAPTSRRPANISTSTPAQRVEGGRRAEAERAEQATLRAQARVEEKARKAAVKQAQADAKAAAVRAERKLHKQKAEEFAKQEAKRLAKVRAKVGAPPLGRWGALPTPADDGESSRFDTLEEVTDDLSNGKPSATDICHRYGKSHKDFFEWRKCNLRFAAKEDSEPSGSHLVVV